MYIEVIKVVSVFNYVDVNYIVFVSDHPLPSPPSRTWQTGSEGKENLKW